MDKDLIAYLDERFRETSQQLANFREEAERRLDERFREASQQLAGFREESDGRFRETSQQIASFRDETERRFEETNQRFEKVEDGVRHTQIMVEGVRGDVQLVAEGVAGFDGKLASHRLEFKEEIEDVKALLRLSYGDLNRRIA